MAADPLLQSRHPDESIAQMDLRVTELHSIMPIGNVASVVEHGILSHQRASSLGHASVAMPEIQDRRDQRQVPGGLPLHHYANLYFHARNPMLFRRISLAAKLCILRVSIEVLDLPGTVLADCNASSEYVRFFAPSQWAQLDFDAIYARDWRHQDNRTAFLRHRSRKCAEVLVPHCVDPRYLQGAYVIDQDAAGRLLDAGFALPVSVDQDMFFR